MEKYCNTGYCQCGCGGVTKVSNKTDLATGRVKGQQVKFIKGHNRRLDLNKRFWAKVQKTDTCWLWTGFLDRYGYFPHQGKRYGAHRFSWELFFGKIPSGLFVLHKCDNPACVNPDHLFLGTQKENMEDMVNKGRSGKKPKYGKNNHMSVLNEVAVREIRSLDGTFSRRELSEKYGVTRQAIGEVIRRVTWAQVQ